MKYRCTKDVINKIQLPVGPYIDADYEADVLRQFHAYSFIQGYIYTGQPGNHPETKQPGVMFQNHGGVDHFISEALLREHFQEVREQEKPQEGAEVRE